jgi:hypothetical protein
MFRKHPLTLLLVACADTGHTEDVVSKLKDAFAAFKACRDDTQDERLNILRNKIRLYDEAITPQMLALELKPIPAEVSALRTLYDVQVRCSMRIAQMKGASKASPLWLDGEDHQTLSALALLIHGYATYADYARWYKAHLEMLIKRISQEAEKRDQDRQSTDGKP